LGLTGTEGQKLLSRRPELRDARSVIWSRQLAGGREQVLIRSDAVLAALARRGGAWKLCGVLTAVPRPLRDAVYLWFAARRHLFSVPGRENACPMPPPRD
jgi:predicted DCC family thiol-disulfide oxidoreductase YuxK